MAITRTLLIHVFILSLAVFCLKAKNIKECDGIEKNYIENPSNCSEFIYCDGASSIYCSGDCSEEIDCDAQLSTVTSSTTNATTSATITNTATKTSTTITSTSTTTDLNQTTAKPTTRPPVPTTSHMSSLPTTLRVETTTKPSSVSTTTAPITTPSVRQLCRKGSFGKYPFPANCNYYYDCLDGFLMLQQCPFGMGWNVKTQNCMILKKALCPNEQNL